MLSYYQNVRGNSAPSVLALIHSTVMANKPYAVLVYRSKADDALDATLHHVIKKYSFSKGDLQNYVISILKDILKNNGKDKVDVDEEKFNFLLDDKLSTVDYQDRDKLEDFLTDNVSLINECVFEFLDYLIEDFAFFRSQDKRVMKVDYGHILGKYSSGVLVHSLDIIQREYVPMIEPFIEFNFNLPIEIPSSIGTGLYPILGKKNNIVLIGGSSSRALHEVDVTSFTEKLITEVYDKSPLPCKVSIKGVRYYKKINGGITTNLSEVKEEIKLLIYSYLKGLGGTSYVGEFEDKLYFFSKLDYTALYINDIPLVLELPSVIMKEVKEC